MNYTINYTVEVDGSIVSGTVDAENVHMTRKIARQYAAKHLWDTTDVSPSDIIVYDINTSWVEL